MGPRDRPRRGSRDDRRGADRSAGALSARREIFTLGHSTHPLAEFLELLHVHEIEMLADVRSFPSSRRWPWFNQAELASAVAASGREYRWFKALGGRRRSTLADSPHRAWEHPAFRAYADYTGTPEFAAGLAELCDAAQRFRTAIMCSEGLWWRCHRRIVSDHLTVRGWRVRHILPDGKIAEHELTPFASVAGERIVYDGGQAALGLK